jgi:hypothetical protein
MVDDEPTDEPTRPDVPEADDATRVDAPAVDEPTMAMAAPTGGPPPADLPPTGEPPAEPPDRRPWILGGLVALIVAVALAVLLLGDDDDETATGDTTTTSAEETTTSTTAPTTTTAAPTTTTTAPTTTTSAPPTTIDPARCTSSPPDDPEPTAEIFFEAYTVGDRSCAGQVGTADAVDTLFAIPGGGAGWTFQGCAEEDDPEPHTVCAYSFEGGSTAFRLAYGEFDGWTVYEVFQVAD